MSRWKERGTGVLLAAALATAPAAAQITEIEPGVRYDAGTRVGVAALGASFVIPANWIGTLPPGAEAFVLGSEVVPVVAASPPAATGDAADWDALVRGRKLHYIYSNTGFTDEEQIDLCADGSFAKRGGGGGFGGGTPGASGAWQHSGGGTWSISGNVLQLHYASGEEGNYTLSYEDEKLYLDGSRYFRVETDSCR